MEAIEGEASVLLKTSVDVLLDKLDSTEFVHNFRTTKLDVSLLEKLKTTLLILQDEKKKTKNHLTVGDRLDFMRRNAVFQVYNLFDKINSSAFYRSEHAATSMTLKDRHINYELQRSIERLEFLSSGVSNSSSYWFNHDLVDVEAQFLSFSTYVKALLVRLDSIELYDNFRTKKLDVSLLKKLRTTLQVFHHAEEEQILTVGHWLDILRNAVFEVGYFLDEINPEALLCKVGGKLKNPSSAFKQCNGVSNSKFQKLIERLEFLSSRALGQFVGSCSKSVWNESPTCSVLDDEFSIYGRDNDIEKLKHILLSSDGDSKIGIISIVGIEGIGKTTLAKLLYNDPEVYDNFELRVWEDISTFS